MLGVKEKCKDQNPSCADWARSGQCDANPAFMLISCRKACKACTEHSTGDADGVPCVNASPDNDCEYWSTMGECTSNAAYMREACARSCGICTVAEHELLPDDDDHLDDDDDDDDDGLPKDEL